MNRLVSSLAAVFFTLAVLSAPEAKAATLYLDPNETEIHPGDTISMAVRLDTDENECVNVIDGVIAYSETVTLVDVSLGNSILPVWVENPSINTNLNQLTFAGGIPNGYCGRIAGDPRLTNVILDLIFQVSTNLIQTDPLARIEFLPATKVLLNDGLGTVAPLATINGTIYVHDEPGDIVVSEWNERIENDNIPPNEFSITLSSDPSIFGGAYFVVFNTTDKQSGIDHYEIIEEPLDQLNLFNWGSVDAPWITIRSPYRLKDQSLNSTIRVKAVDKAGNEYIAVYVPDESQRGVSLQQMLIFGMGFLGFALIILLLVTMYYYRRRISLPEDYSENEADFSSNSDHTNLNKS